MSDKPAPPEHSPHEAALRRAVAWLLAQQADEGGWHSETYGAMRGGASLTSLVLYALAHAPDDVRKSLDAKRIEAAFDFLRRGIAKQGFVVCPDGSLDYPTYSTAMALLAAPRLGVTFADEEREQLVSFLLAGQRNAAAGFEPDDRDYGGWDLSAGSGLEGVSTGTNISVTSFALEALQSVDAKEADAAKKLAEAWLAKVQNLPKGGGFYFHPTHTAEGNKAERNAEGRPRSYGTATCDGLRCLGYLGVGGKDKRRDGALAWLTEHLGQEGDEVPGFSQNKRQLGWEVGLRFYYYMSLSKALPLLPDAAAEKQRKRLTEILLEKQRDDGSFQNASARMREDDPLIATSFAVIVLGTSASGGK